MTFKDAEEEIYIRFYLTSILINIIMQLIMPSNSTGKEKRKYIELNQEEN